MTITGATGGKGTRAILTRYPPVLGTTGATTKQEGKTMNLTPRGLGGRKSAVTNRTRTGID